MSEDLTEIKELLLKMSAYGVNHEDLDDIREHVENICIRLSIMDDKLNTLLRKIYGGSEDNGTST